MSNAQIQIQFPTPGVWDKMTMTVVYEDADGYTHSVTYTQDKIPADQAPALASVVSALVGLAEPWQTRQVWARLELHPKEIIDDDGNADSCGTPAECTEVVSLTVEATNNQGGRRIFTNQDYEEFTIADAAAVAFFNYFAGNQA